MLSRNYVKTWIEMQQKQFFSIKKYDTFKTSLLPLEKNATKGNNTYLADWDINKILSDIISSNIIDIIIKYQIL